MLKKILLILFVVAACGFYLLFIRPAQLPRPASSSYREISFKVGRIDYFLEDRSRVDPHQQALHEFRIVPVSFYYPVSCGEKKLPSPLPYSPQMIEKVKSVAEKHFRMPRILLRPLDKLKTHSYKDAPLSRSDEQYPLIIFEHGLGSTPDFYTNLIEHLVARGGFIVAAISHAYASRNVILPDGKILKSALWWDGMRYPRKAVMREIEQQLWMEDVLFLLDQLFTKKLQSPVITAIDVERIGIIGHSFGGSTAAQLCRLDNRIKAGVNMDGGLNGPDFLEPFDKPFMIISADHALDNPTQQELLQRGYATKEEFEDGKLHAQEGLDILFSQLANDKFFLVFKGADHDTFSDAPLFLRSFFLAKFLIPQATQSYYQFTNECIRDFFNAYVVSKPKCFYYDEFFSKAEGKKVIIFDVAKGPYFSNERMRIME